jgi:hypothetical protein
MRILSALRTLGVAAQSIKGWMAIASIAPSIFATALGVVEGKPWSELALLAMSGLALGMIVTFYAIRLYQEAQSHLTGRRDRKRIADTLQAMRDSGDVDIDTPTIAAIWAGTREEGNLMRHVRFRQVKALIRSGKLRNPMQRGAGNGPNIHTWVTLDELERCFRSIGVLPPDA